MRRLYRTPVLRPLLSMEVPLRSVFAAAVMAVMCVGSCVSATGADVVHLDKVVLLQPDLVLNQRAPDAALVASYVKAVLGTVRKVMDEEAPHPASGFVVLAVRPAKRSMVWLDFAPPLTEPLADRLRAAVLAVAPFEARDGVVVFAVNLTLWNGAPRPDFRAPAEWREAVGRITQRTKQERVEIGDLVDEIWPDKTGP